MQFSSVTEKSLKNILVRIHLVCTVSTTFPIDSHSDDSGIASIFQQIYHFRL